MLEHYIINFVIFETEFVSQSYIKTFQNMTRNYSKVTDEKRH